MKAELVESRLGKNGSYIAAQDIWKVMYLAESAKVAIEFTRLGLPPNLIKKLSYHANKYEVEAKAKRREVETAFQNGNNKNPCYP